METKQITVTEALERTIRTLEGIMIPAGLSEQIGKPILGCIGNIQQCIDAMNRPAEPEPEMGMIPEDGELNG